MVQQLIREGNIRSLFLKASPIGLILNTTCKLRRTRSIKKLYMANGLASTFRFPSWTMFCIWVENRVRSLLFYQWSMHSRRLWNLVHQTLSANLVGTVFDVCERIVPPSAVAVHTIPDNVPWRQEKLSEKEKLTAPGGTSRSHTSNTVPAGAVGREGLVH